MIIENINGWVVENNNQIYRLAPPENITIINRKIVRTIERLYGDKITEIDFSNCNKLTVIEMSSFSGFTALKGIDLLKNKALRTIGNFAFGACVNVEWVDLSECVSLQSIGKCSFGLDKKLKKVNLSGCENLEKIDKLSFSGCDELTEVDLTGCAKVNIDDGTFNKNVTLKGYKKHKESSCDSTKEQISYEEIKEKEGKNLQNQSSSVFCDMEFGSNQVQVQV